MKIAEFQALMQTLYYKNDEQRGVHRTAIWLGEELGELFKELKHHPQKFDKAAIEEEMADIYAWVASLANLLDIDLEQALQKKYHQQCPKCHQNPCVCQRNLP